MNGPDHYREAERLLEEAGTREDFNPRAQWCLELAKLHIALAHVAATAQASDSRDWVKVAGPGSAIWPRPYPSSAEPKSAARALDSKQ